MVCNYLTINNQSSADPETRLLMTTYVTECLSMVDYDLHDRKSAPSNDYLSFHCVWKPWKAFGEFIFHLFGKKKRNVVYSANYLCGLITQQANISASQDAM